MNKNEIEELISNNPEYSNDLFIRGFLLSTKKFSSSEYPFYNNWNIKSLCKEKYFLYVNKEQNLYIDECKKSTLVLVGHAYNPFTMQYKEDEIVKELNELYSEGFNKFINKLNQLTGLFFIAVITDDKIVAFSDCAGMYSSYYGLVDTNVYFTSHFQLVADLCNLKQSKYVQGLTKYKFYPKYGNFLPGNISAYDNLKRIVPNTYITYTDCQFIIDRLYPNSNQENICKNQISYDCLIKEVANIMHNNMELISKKWSSPAISLTGGMDSKTTLACTNGFYDKFNYFSYISMTGEKIDADAAHIISKNIGIDHKIYQIPNECDKKEYDITKKILIHNFGEIGSPNDNDVKKRIYFKHNNDFDVEVKSWVSEIGRANYYKKFGKSKMPKHLSPRQMSSMYKLFLWQRTLLKSTDKIFSQYITETQFGKNFADNFDESDMYLWEFRYGSWGGMVITCEHMYSYNITIPYNNRILIDKLLKFPLKSRIDDTVHYDIIRYMNKKIDDTGITITNYNETKMRMIIEKIYFDINSFLFF